jgi:hypothetical protein
MHGPPRPRPAVRPRPPRRPRGRRRSSGDRTGPGYRRRLQPLVCMRALLAWLASAFQLALLAANCSWLHLHVQQAGIHPPFPKTINPSHEWHPPALSSDLQ